MSWSEVIDQERAVQVLRGAIERDRVAHAYLFHGPDGVGKRATAIEFARALLCEREGPDACGECTSCKRVRQLTHPDVHFFIPAPKDFAPADMGKRLALLGENPYAVVDYIRRPSLQADGKETNKQAFYAVDRIREELRMATSYASVEGRYKVVILTDVDLMRDEAANAFLKTLEEPPPRTVFILTTARVDRLLPTILSRCQHLGFGLLAAEAIEQALVARGADPARAGTLARMADGSFSRALELAEDENLTTDRELVRDYLRRTFMIPESPDELMALLSRLSGMTRERAKDFLRLMLTWIRDLALYRALGAEAALVNVDQADSIAKFCTNLPRADHERMAALAEEAIELIERNVNQKLLFNVLTLALNRAMQGKAGAVLYAPLVG